MDDERKEQQIDIFYCDKILVEKIIKTIEEHRGEINPITQKDIEDLRKNPIL